MPKSVRAAYDASPYASFKHSTYFNVYDQLIGRFVGRPVVFVEVGVFNGGSLFMWREFLGPDARIIGIDQNPDAARWRDEGFEIFIGDQADPDFWKDVFAQVGPVDVVLDDGGHTYAQQIVTVEQALDVVRDGGLVIVEDTHTSYMAEFGGPSRHSFVEYATAMVDRINARFGGLKGRRETRVHAITFYESIVAFHVDRHLASAPSVPTMNAGHVVGAKDYRYADSPMLSWLKARGISIGALRTKPGWGPRLASGMRLLVEIRNRLINRKLRRYF